MTPPFVTASTIKEYQHLCAKQLHIEHHVFPHFPMTRVHIAHAQTEISMVVVFRWLLNKTSKISVLQGFFRRTIQDLFHKNPCTTRVLKKLNKNCVCRQSNIQPFSGCNLALVNKRRQNHCLEEGHNLNSKWLRNQIVHDSSTFPGILLTVFLTIPNMISGSRKWFSQKYTEH
jgi:hypothetical protein